VNNGDCDYGIGPYEDDDPIWTVTNFFESVSPEIRLMYMPPVNNDQFNSSNPEGFSGIANKLGTDTVISTAMESLGKTQRAYRVVEVQEQETFTRDGGLQPATTVTRNLHPIPLIDTSRVEAREGSENCKYSDWLSGSINDYINLDDYGNSALSYEFAASTRQLKDKLLNSTEFKLLFDFVFPIDRYLSMVTAYSILASSSVDGVARSFNNTKDELFNLFAVLQNVDYRQTGPSSEDALAMAQDFSDPEETCFSFDFKGLSYKDLLDGDFGSNIKTDWDKDDNPFKSLGLSAIADNATEAGKKLFKKMTEFVDPNIKAARAIKTISKSFGFCGDKELPLWLISFLLLPPFLPLPPPWGQIQFTLTPFGIAYLFGWSWDDKEVQYFSKKPNIDCNEIDFCTASEKQGEPADAETSGVVLRLGINTDDMLPNNLPSLGGGKHIIAVGESAIDTFGSLTGVFYNSWSAEAGSGENNKPIVIEQGVEMSAGVELEGSLKEMQYKIEIDHRLGRAMGLVERSRSGNIATYYVSRDGDSIVKDIPLADYKPATKGPRGTMIELYVGTNILVGSPLWANEALDGIASIDGVNYDYKYIDSHIKVIGANTGAEIFIPIRFVRR
jgi:hypothetical protein